MVVAEIGGVAPAAGTILAMCCDARISSDGNILGLNESAFGLVAPFFAMDMAKDLMGLPAAYRAISIGVLFKGAEAVNVGLVDKMLGPEEGVDKLRAAALEECELWISKPGRSAAKKRYRADMLARWHAGREADKQIFMSSILDPLTQQRLGQYLDSLKKK